MTDIKQGSNPFDDDEEENEISQSEKNMSMSIFASYYGIESNSNNSKENKLVIDHPQFDANEYFQHLLETQTVEYLVATDVKLIHEVRVSSYLCK